MMTDLSPTVKQEDLDAHPEMEVTGVVDNLLGNKQTALKLIDKKVKNRSLFYNHSDNNNRGTRTIKWPIGCIKYIGFDLPLRRLLYMDLEQILHSQLIMPSIDA